MGVIRDQPWGISPIGKLGTVSDSFPGEAVRCSYWPGKIQPTVVSKETTQIRRSTDFISFVFDGNVITTTFSCTLHDEAVGI